MQIWLLVFFTSALSKWMQNARFLRIIMTIIGL